MLPPLWTALTQAHLGYLVNEQVDACSLCIFYDRNWRHITSV